jgi:hypothetical protein
MTGSLNITGGLSGNNSSAYSSATRIIFNNDYNDVARGPNKITLYDSSWLAGFGVHNDTVSYYAGGTHKWYQATTTSNASLVFSIDSTGNVTPAGNLYFSKASDPKIYAGTGVGLNIEGEALYLNRYTSSNIAMVNGGGVVRVGHNTDYGAILSVKQPTSGNILNLSNGADADLNFLITQTGAGTKYARITPSVAIPLILCTTSGSNVGIGSTTASYKLDVTGQIRVDNGVANGAGTALIVGGSGDVTLSDGGSLFWGAYDYSGSTYIRGYDNSAVMYFYLNGTNRVTFNSSGIEIPGGNGINFTAGNSRIYFNSYRALEGSTTGSNLQIGEGYTQTQMQSGTLKVDGGISDTSFYRVTNPNGATYVTSTSSITGAIKIQLPVYRTATMMRLTVKIYQYNTGECTTIECGGYNYSANTTWYNVFAYQVSDGFRDISVRFGYESGYDCIWIGETTDGWTYPQVFVTEWQGGYSGMSASYTKNWAISFVSTLGTVTGNRTAYKQVNQAGGAITGTLDVTNTIRLSASESRKLVGENVNGYNSISMYGNWDSFQVMGRVLDWSSSNLHFGNGYNGVSHASYYFVLGNPVSYFKVEGPIYATGDIVAYYSDRRLKQNIEPINGALNIIDRIGAYTFEWNKKSEEVWAKKEGDKDFGLISQEVESVWPMGVAIQGAKDINDKYGYGDPDSEYYDPLHIERNPEEYKTVRYDKMVTLAIAAIKEQQVQIEFIKEENRKLQEKNQEFETILNSLINR